MNILVVNAGSSSLKLRVLGPADEVLASADLPALRGAVSVDAATLSGTLDGLGQVAAVGHRVVHGGTQYSGPVLVTGEVRRRLEALTDLAPLHQPKSLAAMDAVAEVVPGVPAVACFDTAFHAAMPRASKLLPLPRRYEAQGLRRYGFHGLSYTYLVAELARVAGPAAARDRVILAHLGSGASLAALVDGACVDTTMSFTPNSGVTMGTRTGDLDPGVVLHLMRVEPRDANALDALLSKESGLLGVSGTSADMRDLLARESTDAAAADAVALFVRGVHKAVGALATTIGGLDTLVFSGGIGEHAAPVRARICAALAHLGVELDPTRNEAHAPVISSDASARTVRVIPTDEEVVIARETMRVLSGGGAR